MPEVLPVNSDIDYANVTANGVRQTLPQWVAALSGSSGPTPTEVPTTVSNSSGTTLSAAAILSRSIYRTGLTAAATDTLDTGVNIQSALPTTTPLSRAWEMFYTNTTAFAATIQGASGSTLSGLGVSGNAVIIPANSTAKMLFTYSAANTFTLFVLSIAYNAANGYDPSTVQTQAGGSIATFLEEGNVSRQVLGSGAGVSPAATGADNVLAVYTLPANAFDVAGRGISIQANGSVAANGNTKRLKLIVNPSTAVVGSTVGTGGTTICDTGNSTANGVGWSLGGEVFKYGAAGSNTQQAYHAQAQMGTAISSMLSPTNMTAAENGAILIALTGNATTTATDIVANLFTVQFMN